MWPAIFEIDLWVKGGVGRMIEEKVTKEIKVFLFLPWMGCIS